MELNEVLIQAFVNRIKVGQMEIDDIPIPYQKEVGKRLNPPIEVEIIE